MSTSEKFCLKWNDFQQNLTTTFTALREDADFADVTLVCEDGQQVEAHKVILAASSPFFQNLLRRNKHSHPLIYMRGMKSDDLVAMVDFLYYGETNIYQDNLDSFLTIAEELKLRGLTGGHKGSTKDGNDSEPTEPKLLQKPKECSKKASQFPTAIVDSQRDRYTPQPKIIAKISNQMTKPIEQAYTVPKDESETNHFDDESSFDGTIVHQPEFLSANLHSLDEKIKSMYVKKDGQKIYVCNICGKEANRNNNMKDHIEANHLEGIYLPCNLCDKTFRSRNSLRNHKASQHKY